MPASCLALPIEHHICYFGRFPVSQFNDSLGGVDLKCTQWVHFRSTQPKLYFPKIMEFSHYNEYGVIAIARPQSLSAQTFLQAYCSYFEIYGTIPQWKLYSLSWQWPTSSLSMGVAKVVATVCKTAITLCSHCRWAPKCLSLLIFTSLEIWALKLGDGHKIEPTT